MSSRSRQGKETGPNAEADAVSLTEDQVRARTKTVTRRLGWRTLQAGDRLTLCAKVMGRRVGEPLNAITAADVAAEGFEMTPAEFVAFFCATHRGCTPETEITCIAWRYLDKPADIRTQERKGEQGSEQVPIPGGGRPGNLRDLAERSGGRPGHMSDAEQCHLTGTGQESAAPLTERRFTALDGVPAQDDPELAVLMQAVRRLPRDRADTVIESMLRCALGYSRTGNWEFLTRLASNALVTFRTRTDPENQKALDAVPADPGPAAYAADLDEMFARLGLGPARDR